MMSPGSNGRYPGQALDQSRHAEKKFTRTALLQGLLTDRALQLDVVGIVELVDRHHPWADRCKAGEGLALAELRCGPGQFDLRTDIQLAGPAPQFSLG